MTEISRRGLLATGAAAAGWGALPLSHARAQAAGTIKIGVLTDMSGLYRDLSGPGSTACVRQAVSELGALGFKVEVVQADIRTSPMSGTNIGGMARSATGSISSSTSDLLRRARSCERHRAREEQGLHQQHGASYGPHPGAQC